MKKSKKKIIWSSLLLFNSVVVATPMIFSNQTIDINKTNIEMSANTSEINNRNINLPNSLTELKKMSVDDVIKAEKFDGTKYGYTPDSIVQQSVCWAAAAANASISNILYKGIYDSLSKSDFDWTLLRNMEKNIDHVTIIRTKEADRLGLTQDDVYGGVSYGQAGEVMRAATMLQQWNAPLTIENKTDFTAYSDKPLALLKNTKMLNGIIGNVEEMKKEIIKNGALTIGYPAADLGYRTYYNNKETKDGSHASIIIGWDDTVKKESFNVPASRDGAWIVKNSWGSNAHRGDGCFYLSYDGYISNLEALDYTSNDSYENNYYYDGWNSWTDESNQHFVDKNVKEFSAIFPTKKASYNKSEFVKAVNVGISGPKTKVVAKVYTNVADVNAGNRFSAQNDPTKGTLVATKEQYFEYPGIYTIDLDKEVEIKAGDYFSVVIEIKESGDNKSVVNMSREENSLNDLTFYKDPETNKWINCWKNNSAVARIKAFTVTKEKEGQSDNNLRFAKVSLDKTSIRYKSGEQLTPEVWLDNKKLIQDVDYRVTYKDDLFESFQTSSDNAMVGSGILTITGMGQYNGITKTNYNILVSKQPKELELIGDKYDGKFVYFNVDNSANTYSDIELPNNWKWTFPENKLENGENIGNYIAYYAEDAFCFRKDMFEVKVNKTNISIPKVDISNAHVEIIDKQDFIYDGSEKKPAIKVTTNEGNQLTEFKDYSVEYKKNIDASNQAKIIVRGTNKYEGLITKNFEILKAENTMEKPYFDQEKGEIEFEALNKENCTFEYYSDANLTNKLDQMPTVAGDYWLVIIIPESNNYKELKSDAIPIKVAYNNNQQENNNGNQNGGNINNGNSNNNIENNDKPENNNNNQENGFNSNTIENKYSNNNNSLIISLSVIIPLLIIAVATGIFIGTWKRKK